MIGALSLESKSVAVVGAGVSGLLSAYYLDRSGYDVHLFEKERRPGGLIRTTLTPFGFSESAAHSMLATDALRDLCEDLDVKLVPVNKQSKARYIFRDQEMRRFPLNFGEALDLFRRASTTRSNRTVDSSSESIADWAERHLGAGALKYLVNPFVCGIYAASPDELSMRAVFPAISDRSGETFFRSFLNQRKTKRQKTKREMVAPRDGMGSLISALERRLQERLGERFRTGVGEVPLGDFKNRVLCVDAASAGALIEKEDTALAAQLKEVKYSPLVSVTAFVRRSDFTRPIRGVGVLIPATENIDCLGILFNSSAFPDRVRDAVQHESFTVMFGGTRNPKWVESSDFSIKAATKRALQDVLRVRNEPAHCEIHRWKKAIPLYDSQLEGVWDLAKATWCSEAGNILFGNYAGQVSIRGMIEAAHQNFGSSLSVR